MQNIICGLIESIWAIYSFELMVGESCVEPSYGSRPLQLLAVAMAPTPLTSPGFTHIGYHLGRGTSRHGIQVWITSSTHPTLQEQSLMCSYWDQKSESLVELCALCGKRRSWSTSRSTTLSSTLFGGRNTSAKEMPQLTSYPSPQPNGRGAMNLTWFREDSWTSSSPGV